MNHSIVTAYDLWHLVSPPPPLSDPIHFLHHRLTWHPANMHRLFMDNILFFLTASSIPLGKEILLK